MKGNLRTDLKKSMGTEGNIFKSGRKSKRK
jgi:hypothetical protein